MNFKHSLHVQISPNTILSSYGSDTLKTCCFMENGESCSISFNVTCIKQLDEFIDILTKMRSELATQRAIEIQKEAKELKATEPHGKKNGNGTYTMTGL